MFNNIKLYINYQVTVLNCKYTVSKIYMTIKLTVVVTSEKM